MMNNPASAESPTSFAPETTQREVVEEIDERQEVVLRRTGLVESSPLFSDFHKFSGIAKSNPIEPILVPFEIESGFEQSLFKKISKQLQEPVSPEHIERETVEIALDDLEAYDKQTQEAVCDRVLDIYLDLDVAELTPEEIVNVQQAANKMEDFGREEIVTEANTLTQEFFEGLNDHPLVSKREESTLDESLTFDEARSILRNRSEDLRETAKEVFGEVDEEIIQQMQQAYLKLIWDDIE